MKFLLDENMPMTIKKILNDNGYDVEHVNQNLKGKTDKEVFEYAVKNKMCIITFDCDFNNLKKEKHYGIIKIDNITDNYIEKLLSIIKKEKEGFEDIYICIGRKQNYKEIKKYTKKKKRFKQFQRILLEVV